MMTTLAPPRDSSSLKNLPAVQSIVDVTMKSDVVPRTNTLSTWLPPNLIERLKFDVGTAITRLEFGVAAIIRFNVSSYSGLIFLRSRQCHQSSTGFHGQCVN